MVGEHIKAMDKFAEWERSDPGWVRIVNNDFPVNFAWPIGWLPLNSKYAPASGETTKGLINYLRKKQGEEVNASYLRVLSPTFPLDRRDCFGDPAGSRPW